jgi:hypothetical protein
MHDPAEPEKKEHIKKDMEETLMGEEIGDQCPGTKQEAGDIGGKRDFIDKPDISVEITGQGKYNPHQVNDQEHNYVDGNDLNEAVIGFFPDIIKFVEEIAPVHIFSLRIPGLPTFLQG